MRSKAPLALLEQVVMLAVFALAAVLCLRAFLWADARSRESALRDRAMVEVQSAAETVKSCRGDLSAAARILGGRTEGELWIIGYDARWEETAEDSAEFWLYVCLEPAAVEGLGQARVWMEWKENGEALFEVTVAWQEVEPHG